MAKLKVDLSGVKNFFFEKGDKLALVLCLAAMGVLVGFGILNGMSAKTVSSDSDVPWAKALEREAANLKDKLAKGVNVPPLPKIEHSTSAWAAVEPIRTSPTPLFWLQDDNKIKRINPRVSAPLARSQPREVQMDYVRGSYFAYEVDHGNNQIWIIKDRTPIGGGVAPGVGVGKKKDPNQQKREVTPTVVTRPVRMVVVNMVFPLRQQLVEFQRAFRMKTLFEVFESKDLPRFLGINVWKTEVVDGKPGEWKALITPDAKNPDKIEIHSQTTREMLREALPDDTTLEYNGPFFVQGLAMPLPKLALLPTFAYPEVKLEGLEYNFEAGGFGGAGDRGGAGGFKLNLPAMGGGAGGEGGGRQMAAGGGAMAGAEVEFESKPWRGLRLPPDVAYKLADDFYPLDPLSIHPDPELPVGKMPVGFQPQPAFGQNLNPFAGGSPFAPYKFWEGYPLPPMPVGLVGPGGERKQPVFNKFDPNKGGTAALQKPYDGQIRFFDPDVRPGKTYQYLVQVRMANPNYNKKNDVAFPGLAVISELPPSPPVETPTITIPDEFNLYAVDQKPEPAFQITKGSDKETAKSDQVAVQIHRWVDETTDVAGGAKYVIGDWAIAERLLVRRGQPLGRDVNVEVPIWKKDKNAFELGVGLERAQVNDGKKKGVPKQPMPAPMPLGGAPVAMANTGVPVDFALTNPAAMLVDFDGGKKEVKLGGPVATKDESASNILILQPDGRMIVRNTRVDADTSTPESEERLQRIEQWKKKIAPFRMQDSTTMPGGVFPGGFPGAKKGSS